ncbi:GrpB family protein [Streptococcus dentasini]
MNGLEDMSSEELRQLFPIFLVAHNDDWTNWYEEEKKSILDLLAADKFSVSVHHIGSTAIPKIWAKNIVDILLEADNRQSLQEIKTIMLANGWLFMSKTETRISLKKGYTTSGFAPRVFHLHLRLLGDCDELYFRDYLIKHPETAKAYEELKLSLWKKFEHDRDSYTEAKADFIRKYTELEKQKGDKNRKIP